MKMAKKNNLVKNKIIFCLYLIFYLLTTIVIIFSLLLKHEKNFKMYALSLYINKKKMFLVFAFKNYLGFS